MATSDEIAATAARQVRTCINCGQPYLPTSIRQRWCAAPACQAERKRVKAGAYYRRKRAQKLTNIAPA